MAEKIEIKIPARPIFLRIVRLAVNHVCERIGFPQDEANNITLAVDEACSNIIKHAYCGNSDEVIEATFQMYDDRLEVLLRDFGRKANPDKIKPRKLDDVRPGGLGVHLIKSVMDVVQYDTAVEHGNLLLLVKYITK
ncbi:MAG: ATP-binding protein [Candidatus Zhuqueibacterota bacterium]